MRHLLASDLDGTLLPPVDSPRAARSVEHFRRAVQGASPSWILAYVTGRHLELALEGVASVGLPRPHAFACDVGTSVWWWEEGEWVADEGFRDELRSAMGGADAEAVRRILEDVAGLEPQPEEKQGAFKASYDFPWDDRSRVMEEVARRLGDAGVRSRRVVSRDVGDGHGIVDVLPEGGAKDRAVRHLARTLGIPEERVAFAGDSGNDTAALLGGWRAVLVGNAPDALREEIRDEAARRSLTDRVHLARASWADGVLEGLDALGISLTG